MANKLFSTKNRDASHRALEYARGERQVNGPDIEFPGTEAVAGRHELAHCREDPNKGEYSVWDGPEPPNAKALSALLHDAVLMLQIKVGEEVITYLKTDIYMYDSHPTEVQKLFDSTSVLMSNLRQPVESNPAELLPYLKRAILEARLRLANKRDESRPKVSDPNTVEKLNKQLEPYDEIMKQDWFKRTEAAKLPQLTDFLTIERAEHHLSANNQQERRYDEKFHILQAPNLFLPDLDHYRKKCGMRNLPLIVAYMDIDKFKEFNTKHGETYIDLHLLPRFMAALEAHVYVRGFAYRFGGDEYAVLLPNTDSPMGISLLKGFQKRIEHIDYQGIALKKPTVSIGFCEVPPDCHFTNQELLSFAESAKKCAKENGRNRVATFSDSLYKNPHVLN